MPLPRLRRRRLGKDAVKGGTEKPAEQKKLDKQARKAAKKAARDARPRRLPRPGIPGRKRSRPKAAEPKAAETKAAGAKPTRKKAARAKASRRRVPRPSRPGFVPKDIRFRTTTRFKALGYGSRELAWKVSRGWDRRVEGPVRRFWERRSPATHRRVLAVAGVAAFYLLIKFIPLPGVPCQISASKECAPGDEAIALAPADSLVYAHMTLDRNTGEYDRAGDVLGRFSRFGELGQALIDTLPAPSGKRVAFDQVRSWAGDDAALAVAPASGGVRSTVVMISVDDEKGAEAFTKTVAPPGAAQATNVGGVKLSTYPGGFATAIAKGFLLLGGQTAVTAAITSNTGKAKSLEDDPVASQTRDALPDNRFADVYVSAAGVQQILTPSASTAAKQLESFVDYGATKGFAATAVAKQDGIEMDVVSALDPAKVKKSPNVFTTLPSFEPTLANDVGSRAIAYLGIGDAGKSIGTLLQRAASAQPGLAKSLAAFTQKLQQEAKVDPSKDLLPALGGQAALVAEPTDGIPFASLIVDGVDEKKARAALARLQTPLVKALSPPAGETRPGFTTTTIDGVEASELQVSPTLNLTYAVFDGKLVVSTQPAGIEQVKKGGNERLSRADAFTDATGPLPDELSALVFVNLDELLDLAEALGRVEDPLYASFRDDIRKLHAAAVGVTDGGNELHSKLFVTIK